MCDHQQDALPLARSVTPTETKDPGASTDSIETMHHVANGNKLGSATQPSPTKKEMEAATVALNHLLQGKRHLLVNDIPSAVRSLQEACELLAELFGETADECGDAYYYYGKALLELARMETGVLGNALDGVPEGDDADNSQVENPENLTEEEWNAVVTEVDEALEENYQEIEKKRSLLKRMNSNAAVDMDKRDCAYENGVAETTLDKPNHSKQSLTDISREAGIGDQCEIAPGVISCKGKSHENSKETGAKEDVKVKMSSNEMEQAGEGRCAGNGDVGLQMCNVDIEDKISPAEVSHSEQNDCEMIVCMCAESQIKTGLVTDVTSEELEANDEVCFDHCGSEVINDDVTVCKKDIMNTKDSQGVEKPLSGVCVIDVSDNRDFIVETSKNKYSPDNFGLFVVTSSSETEDCGDRFFCVAAQESENLEKHADMMDTLNVGGDAVVAMSASSEGDSSLQDQGPKIIPVQKMTVEATEHVDEVREKTTERGSDEVDVDTGDIDGDGGADITAEDTPYSESYPAPKRPKEEEWDAVMTKVDEALKENCHEFIKNMSLLTRVSSKPAEDMKNRNGVDPNSMAEVALDKLIPSKQSLANVSGKAGNRNQCEVVPEVIICKEKYEDSGETEAKEDEEINMCRTELEQVGDVCADDCNDIGLQLCSEIMGDKILPAEVCHSKQDDCEMIVCMHEELQRETDLVTDSENEELEANGEVCLDHCDSEVNNDVTVCREGIMSKEVARDDVKESDGVEKLLSGFFKIGASGSRDFTIETSKNMDSHDAFGLLDGTDNSTINNSETEAGECTCGVVAQVSANLEEQAEEIDSLGAGDDDEVAMAVSTPSKEESSGQDKGRKGIPGGQKMTPETTEKVGKVSKKPTEPDCDEVQDVAIEDMEVDDDTDITDDVADQDSRNLKKQAEKMDSLVVVVDEVARSVPSKEDISGQNEGSKAIHVQKITPETSEQVGKVSDKTTEPDCDEAEDVTEDMEVVAGTDITDENAPNSGSDSTQVKRPKENSTTEEDEGAEGSEEEESKEKSEEDEETKEKSEEEEETKEKSEEEGENKSDEDKDKMEDDDDKTDEDQADTIGETSQDEEEEEEVSNLQLAWEMLELAKIIFKRQVNTGVEQQLKLAQVYLHLGEVSIESENYSQGVADLRECLRIQQAVLLPEDRRLAETNFQLGVTFCLQDEFQESIKHFEEAGRVIEARIKSLQIRIADRNKEKAASPEKRHVPDSETDPFYTLEGEIEELNKLLPEIKEKITDAIASEKEFQRKAREAVAMLNGSDGFGKMVNAAALSGSSSQSTEPKVSTISHLVKRKRTNEEEISVGEGTKKIRPDLQEAKTNGNVSQEVEETAT